MKENGVNVMSSQCNSCGQAFGPGQTLPTYKTDILGIPLHLVNAVRTYSCECTEDPEIVIPNQQGLIAASAVLRALMPHKLNGSEIRYLRKACALSAKDLADLLSVVPETISRWENDKKPIGLLHEKLLRFNVAAKLEDQAPLITVDFNEIMEMKMTGFPQPGKSQELSLELVLRVAQEKQDDDLVEVYREKTIAA